MDNLLSNLKLDSMARRQSLGLGQKIKWVWGPCFWEDLGVHEGAVCVCCVFASKQRAGPTSEARTMKYIRGLGSRQVCLARGAVLILEGSASVCVFVNLESWRVVEGCEAVCVNCASNIA